MTDKTIEVKELFVHANNSRLLGPISFKLYAGQTLVVMGETGAGKSLLAQAILGTLPDGLTATGEIYINSQRVDNLNMKQRAKLWGKDIAILPQEPTLALDPLMKAAPQVKESHRFVAQRSFKEAHLETIQDFTRLNLRGAESHLPNELSGGMAQRVAFASSTAANALSLIHI